MVFTQIIKVSNKKYLEEEMLKAESSGDTEYHRYLKKQYDNCRDKTRNTKR